MQLGNDVVDLKIDAEIRPRFIERILHDDERALYPDIHQNPLLVWTLWAAKEAAFKAYRQNNMRYFLPNLWSVDLKEGRVQFGTQSWLLSIVTTEDAVYATARSADFEAVTVLRSAEAELTPREQSQTGREVLAELLARHAPEANYFKDDGGVPRLLVGQQLLPFSMSHHGRHVLLSLALSPVPLSSPLSTPSRLDSHASHA